MSLILTVVGLGYVGLPLAEEACRSGIKVSGFDMLGVPLWEYAVCKKGGEAPIHAPPPLLRSGADQVVGMAVQLPLALPKLAVTELQVQPAYQVSLLSLTAPT